MLIGRGNSNMCRRSASNTFAVFFELPGHGQVWRLVLVVIEFRVYWLVNNFAIDISIMV
jgi:hypothetical protein